MPDNADADRKVGNNNDKLRKAEKTLREMLDGYQSNITPDQVALVLLDVIEAMRH